MKKVIGNEKVVDFFEKVIKNGNLHHAYLFVGPSGVGKRAFVESLSSKILGVDSEKLFGSPDFILVEREKNQKTGKTKKNIDIEQVRKLRDRLSKFSVGKKQVAVIDGAHLLNKSASNGLLKTLEEPSSHSVIILTANRTDELLPTIQSRCQIISLLPVDEKKIERALLEMGADKEIAAEYAKNAGGLPGLAMSWLDERDKYLDYKNKKENFLEIVSIPWHERLKKVEPLFGDKVDHIAARESLIQVLELWEIEVRDILIGKKKPSEWKGTQSDCVKFLDKLDRTKDLLKQNIHPKLLVEDLLLQIP